MKSPWEPVLGVERLFETALSLFVERGYADVAVGEIAAAAGVGLDELYRRFPRKERFILKLYERLAGDLEARVPELPSGSVSVRFGAIVGAKLRLLAPHWPLYLSILPAALDPGDRLAVLGTSADRVRARVQGVFSAVVHGATDAPSPAEAPRLARLLYAAHLLCVLLATQDRTPDKSATAEGVAFVAELAGLAARKGPGPLGRWLASMAGLPDLGGVADRAGRLAGSIVEPPGDRARHTLAENLLLDLFRHRRLLPGAGPCAKEPCPRCLDLHLPKAGAAIAAGEPIRLVLPAFPAKSANPRKTLGPLPDLGEELALRFLQERCDAIRERYPAGAKLIICSDGRVFNDLVGVTDGDVTAYRRRLMEMIREAGLSDIDVFDLDDVRPGEPFDATRRWLVERHGQSREELERRAEEFDHHRETYNGIHRFLTEDLAAREPAMSRTQARNRSKDDAYEVIRRSDAWSRLVAAYFPDALRLSIHPQPAHAEKVGILLTPSEDAWLTPWHGVVLARQDRFVLTRRADAEALGAAAVERDGRPSHFEMPAATPAKSPRGR